MSLTVSGRSESRTGTPGPPQKEHRGASAGLLVTSAEGGMPPVSRTARKVPIRCGSVAGQTFGLVTAGGGVAEGAEASSRESPARSR